jgi:hypothetical protein
MLHIRPKQYSALQAAQKERFVERMIEFLNSNFDDERNVPESVRGERIHKHTRSAATYGLTTEQQVAGYIVLIKTCGESFDQEPKSRKILTNPGLDGDEKIERLFHAGSGNPTP